jgi:hypothetical protein
MFSRAIFERPSAAGIFTMLTLIAGSLTRMATAVIPDKNASFIPFSDGRAIFYMTSVDALRIGANLGQAASQIGPTLDPKLCSVYSCNDLSWAFIFAA